MNQNKKTRKREWKWGKRERGGEGESQTNSRIEKWGCMEEIYEGKRGRRDDRKRKRRKNTNKEIRKWEKTGKTLREEIIREKTNDDAWKE